MPSASFRATFLVALVAAFIGGAKTEVQAQYSRRTPIVEAVQKTRNGLVTIKIEKSGSRGRKEITGTGVIVDERGYVVTNRHVIASAELVSVTLADGTELKAKVLTDDASYDLAVLRLPPRDDELALQALPLGPGSDLMVGETVIAVGHPFGYTNTVSTGIISALGREITMPNGEVLTNLIQTNASINPGNSGGPLLNINGEVIGINVALREGAQGIAFALNADTVQQVLSRHLSGLRVAGVTHGLNCRETVAEENGPRQRVVVDQVAAKTAAAEAGLKKGDEIRSVADRTVWNRFDLERAFWDCKPGEQIDVVVVRQGKEITVSLELTGGTEVQRTTAGTTRKPKASAGDTRAAGSEAPENRP